MSEWISVEDRLPEDNDEYLVYADGIISLARYWTLTDRWLSCDQRLCNGADTTYWMQLPRKPTN